MVVSGKIAVALGAVASALAFVAPAALAANSVTPISSFDDSRLDLPARPGQLEKALYGPYTIPAAQGGSPGQIHNAAFPVPTPCQGCRITDMVPDLVFADGTTANLRDGIFLHHFVLLNPERQDLICPAAGEAFFGAGNERTHLHLPGSYGYTNSSATWTNLIHLVNLTPVPQSVYIQIVFRHRPLSVTQPARPISLDINQCGGSEYSAPTGYSDAHHDWTSTVGGQVVMTSGHVHDIDWDDPNCLQHCAASGGGLALTSEIVGGPSSVYFGRLPKPSHAGLTGATLCRSEGSYGTSFGAANGFNGHLDTTGLCGIFADFPTGAEPEAYPAGAAYPATGYPLNVGDLVRLHSEYQNNTGAARNDVMGIMTLWVASRPPASPPLKVPLVPSFKQCGTGGNPPSRSHAPPLGTGSCLPAPSGSVARVGLQAAGFAGLYPIPGDVSTTGNQADIGFVVYQTDVRSGTPTGADYEPNAGGPDLTLVERLRITDSANGPSGSDRATATDFDFAVPVDCAATADVAVGSLCTVDTTANTVMPGAIVEGKQTNVQVFRVRLSDSGLNGVRGDGDDSLFEQEGLLAP